MVLMFGTAILAVMQAAPAVAPAPPPPIMRSSTIDVAAFERPRKPNQKAVPLTYPLWVRSNDYPANARIEKREGSTKIGLTIDTEGRVKNCKILQSSGHSDLDMKTCEMVKERARFSPATDNEAEPVESTYEHTVAWKITEDFGSNNSRMAADAVAEAVELATFEGSIDSNSSSLPRPPSLNNRDWRGRDLNDYPEAALERRSQGNVGLMISVSAEGKITDCEVVEPHEDAELNAASCAHADGAEVISVALDLDGQPTEGRVYRRLRWRLPPEETVVTPSRRYSRGPEKLPFIENAMIGAEIEAKADGTVISCKALKEGEFPKQLNFIDKFCPEMVERGVLFYSDLDNKNAQPDPLGANVRFEVRMKASRVDNADKEVEEAAAAQGN